ncbi:MAG TPA: LacI family DNA-binding transcriptional regulator [Acetobacteraceae bacterium]|nr:LacI family DNA-binding transcriptional regulator [Acetobacteraceae bacterium]
MGTRKSRSDGRPTIADVAALAGVGAITVSRALRSPNLVSPALRQSIETAIRTLNYVPNLNASALASARTDVVGLLLPSLTHMVFTDVLRGIYDGIEGTKLQVQLGNTRYDPELEERLVATFLRQKPAAMILSGVEQTAKTRRMLETFGGPVVQIMDLSADPIDQVIGFSHEAAGRRMTEHLIAQGYRRIAFLSGWLSTRSSGRLRGYEQALVAADLEPTVFSLDRAAFAAEPGMPALRELATPAMGRELLRKAKAGWPELDAVFCNNDALAVGVLFECLATGISVPDELGIAGFNDIDVAEAAEPALTTVRTHRWRIGKEAILSIRKRLDGEPAGPRIVDVGFEIVSRRSTARTLTAAH